MSVRRNCPVGDTPHVSEDVLSLQQQAPGLKDYRELHQCEEIQDIRHRWPLLDREPVQSTGFIPDIQTGVHHSHVVLVTGAVGGAGATTVVASLTAAMRHLGRRVAVVDLAPGQDMHLHLGTVDAEGGSRAAPVLIQRAERLADHPLPARWLADRLSSLPRDALDCVLIDCPWHLKPAFQQASALAGRMLVVGTTEPGAVHQMGRVLEGLLSADAGVDIHLLLNRFNPAISLQRDLHMLLHHNPPARLAPVDIPYDSRVSDSLAKLGNIRDCYPDCEAARGFQVLADWLTDSIVKRLEAAS